MMPSMKVPPKLLSLITAMPSAQTTSAERNGDQDIAIWKRGVTL